MALLALVGSSVRALAAAARAEGHEVLALDGFGDADTRALARRWMPLAAPDPASGDGLALHPPALLQGLRVAAAEGAQGWIATSGLEDRPELQHEAEALLPHWGTAARDQARVRDPQVWMPLLERAGVAHAGWASHVPVGARSMAADDPPQPGAWLVKRARGSGGLHQRWGRPGERLDSPFEGAQAWLPGRAQSATFVADGRAAQVLGFNRLHSRPLGDRPFVFAGAWGPVAVPHAVQATAAAALAVLVPALNVRGLGSLDLVVQGQQATVLELNARVPATVALYPHCWPVTRHLAACHRAGHSLWSPGFTPDHPTGLGHRRPGVSGFEIVYAPGAGRVSADLAQALARLDGCADLPHPGTQLQAGMPVCSLQASADDEAGLAQRLATAHQKLQRLLNNLLI